MKGVCSLFNEAIAHLLKTDLFILSKKFVTFFTHANNLNTLSSQTKIQSYRFDGKLLMDNNLYAGKRKKKNLKKKIKLFAHAAPRQVEQI